MVDPIADFLTRIRNAQMARKSVVCTPYSTIKEGVAQVLVKNEFLKSVSIDKTGKFPVLQVELTEKPIQMKRVSKCGQRIYTPVKDIKKICSGFGISILSTPKGIMTGYEARAKNVGGEVLCEIS